MIDDDGYYERTEDNSPSGEVHYILRSLVDEFSACIDLQSNLRYVTRPNELIEDFAQYAGEHVELIERLMQAAKNGMVNINAGNIDNEC